MAQELAVQRIEIVLPQEASTKKILAGSELLVTTANKLTRNYKIAKSTATSRATTRITSLGRDARATDRTLSVLLLLYILREKSPGATLTTKEFLGIRERLPGWSAVSNQSAATLFPEVVRGGKIVEEVPQGEGTKRGAYRLKTIPIILRTKTADARLVDVSPDEVAKLLDLPEDWQGQASPWRFELDSTTVTFLDNRGHVARVKHRAIAVPSSGTEVYRWILSGTRQELSEIRHAASCESELVRIVDNRGRESFEQRFKCNPGEKIEFGLEYVATGMFPSTEEWWGTRVRYPTDALEISAEFPETRLPTGHRVDCRQEEDAPGLPVDEPASWDPGSRRLAWRIEAPGYMLAYIMYWSW